VLSVLFYRRRRRRHQPEIFWISIPCSEGTSYNPPQYNCFLKLVMCLFTCALFKECIVSDLIMNQQTRELNLIS